MSALWRAQLRPATFRGVTFLVRMVEGEYGRRLASHEYPLRDDPWHEDLGRKAKRLSIEGYVVEPNHIAQAKALIAACEERGPATLVHPWLGQLYMVVTECKVRFDHTAGGMATFQLTFAEAGKALYPARARNSTSVTDRLAKAAKDAVLGGLLKNLTFEGVAGWVAEHASGVLSSAMGEINSVLGPGVAGTLTTAAAWAKDLTGVVNTAGDIIRDPTLFAKRVFGLMDMGNLAGIASLVQFPLAVASTVNLFTAPGTFSQTWQSYLPLTQLGLGGALDLFSPSSTPSRKRAASNTAAIHGFVRRAATVEMARVAVRQNYATSNDAAAASAAVAEAVDRELPLASDAEGQALQAVAVATQQAIAARLPDLPRALVFQVAASGATGTTGPLPAALGSRFSFAPGATLPAIVIAQSVYGDDVADVPARGEEIVTRNDVPHPLFVPGGEPLELLSLG